ncbi:hypothetical protein WJX74_005394 [Apatococcus lobatus]|uniref:Uncharacterized protein n=1 Tax=Apatococcus lobatus TaxID=904363 RepID=A0AAW1RS37_9CHLO
MDHASGSFILDPLKLQSFEFHDGVLEMIQKGQLSDPEGIDVYIVAEDGTVYCCRGTGMNETVHGTSFSAGKLLQGSNNSPDTIHSRVTIKLDRHNQKRRNKLAKRASPFLYDRAIMGRLNAKSAACSQPRPHREIPSSSERLQPDLVGTFGMRWKPILGVGQSVLESPQPPADEVDTIISILQCQQSPEAQYSPAKESQAQGISRGPGSPPAAKKRKLSSTTSPIAAQRPCTGNSFRNCQAADGNGAGTQPLQPSILTNVPGAARAQPNIAKPHISMASAPAADGDASSQPTSEENMQPQSGGVSYASGAPQHASAAQPSAAHATASQLKLVPAPDKQRKSGTGMGGKGGEKTCGLCGQHPPSKPEQCKYCRKCSENKGWKPNRAPNPELWVLRSKCLYKGKHPKNA